MILATLFKEIISIIAVVIFLRSLTAGNFKRDTPSSFYSVSFYFIFLL